jgi:hypothetical protein
MHRAHRSALALIGLVLFTASPAQAADDVDLEADFARFLDWFPGEYDNHEQVWQQELDQAENPHEHLHHIFAPVSAPTMGEHTFFVQQYLDGDPKNIYRQRLYSFSLDEAERAIRLDIYSLQDEATYRDAHLRPGSLDSLSFAELIARPGCEVYWTFQEDHFRGYMKEKSCVVISRRSGQEIFITDDLKLTPEEIWIRDEAFDIKGERVFGNPDGIHHKNRKVRYFTGWGGVKQAGPTADKEDDQWHFMRGIIIHNEGEIYPILSAAGEPSGYSVQLARLTEQSTGTQVLKLGLIEDASGYTVAYSWANPRAQRIGINLRWAQVGLTRKSLQGDFGFDPVVGSQPASE